MTAATYQKILEKSRTYTPIEVNSLLLIVPPIFLSLRNYNILFSHHISIDGLLVDYSHTAFLILLQEEKARNIYLQNCREHVHLRERTELEEFLLKELPYNTVPPRYCTNAVMIDHFKFTNGLRRYLHKRIETYREMKLNWYIGSCFIIYYLFLFLLVLFVCSLLRLGGGILRGLCILSKCIKEYVLIAIKAVVYMLKPEMLLKRYPIRCIFVHGSIFLCLYCVHVLVYTSSGQPLPSYMLSFSLYILYVPIKLDICPGTTGDTN